MALGVELVDSGIRQPGARVPAPWLTSQQQLLPLCSWNLALLVCKVGMINDHLLGLPGRLNEMRTVKRPERARKSELYL